MPRIDDFFNTVDATSEGPSTKDPRVKRLLQQQQPNVVVGAEEVAKIRLLGKELVWNMRGVQDAMPSLKKVVLRDCGWKKGEGRPGEDGGEVIAERRG